LQSNSRLGSFNAAVVAVYFTLVWGGDGFRILRSPFHGFEDRLHATAAAYFRALLDWDLNGLVRISNALGALKFLLAAGFAAYVIEFLHASLTRGPLNQQALEYLFSCAVRSLMLWAGPALASCDAALIRLLATEFLLLSGALIVIYIERQFNADTKFNADTNGTAAHVEPEAVPVVI
jgi:hypothetical protein